ncbi:glycosyltransferase family 2 protein [Pedobacter riviphilus]|uniref:Glycosyltransferase family 2 protein n=1 Tax=Pedobacter riviphilus TaxID=2766984 RepID=A0ABX6TST6_9SPHI|nr:glycosyltransferase family A protein [Pedobacter riviphilus]QNR86775.1 glycosyltransferase family 2 protein [Pedobacter riviphilus]
MKTTESKKGFYSGITVIMPTYNQSFYIKAAISSLKAQNFNQFELIIINDGSTDDSDAVIQMLLNEVKDVRYLKNADNKGLGACLNKGIKLAKYGLIAYLPSDDIYYPNHLSTMYDALLGNIGAVASFSGIKYNYSDNSYFSRAAVSNGSQNDPPLQLVQVLHKKNDVRWKERREIVTDSLSLMFWKELKAKGDFVPTKLITAEWVSHAKQRHKLINEFYGGNIFIYKNHYGVRDKLRFLSAGGFSIDEHSAFAEVKGKDEKKASTNPLKILIVGELAYNADRIRALEDRGHKLYGLWIEKPYYYNTIGPIPFCNVEDIPYSGYKERINEIKPDVIYALLNNVAVDLAHEVLMSGLDIPFIWHFKEGPFFCREMGIWDKLADLYTKSDGQIYINEETKTWFSLFFSPERSKTMLLDGDLPSERYFKNRRSKKLSALDGEVHTVIPGRPFGLTPLDISVLSSQKIHIHLYGNHEKTYRNWLRDIPESAKRYLHLHPNCEASNWTAELSKYDAGWLHVSDSNNFGDLLRCEWPDLNYPARMNTLAAAGLPMIQRNNAVHTVASQNLTKCLGIGLFFSTYAELAEKLNDRNMISKMQNKCWAKRKVFSFEFHVDNLLIFFDEVITDHKNRTQTLPR